MSNRHQQSRRRAYGRRQRELRTRRPADWELEPSPLGGLPRSEEAEGREDDRDLLARFARPGLSRAGAMA